MHHQKIRTEHDRANQFFVKSLNGARAEHGLCRCKINQVICMDHEGPELEFSTARAKGLGIRLRYADIGGVPHPRAGREDLQGVTAELLGGLEGVEVTARDGGVNTDAEAAVHPGGRLRLGFGFRAVLVLGVKLGIVDEGKFRHAATFLCV